MMARLPPLLLPLCGLPTWISPDLVLPGGWQIWISDPAVGALGQQRR